MKKQLLLLAVVFMSSVWLLFQLDVSDIVPPALRHHHHFDREDHNTGFLVNTEGCRIQDLDPFDASIKAFLQDDTAPKCNRFKYGRLVKADTESIYVDWSVLENETFINQEDVRCEYCEFWRKEYPYNLNGTYPRTVDTESRFSTECKGIDNRTFITNEEFIQVECFADDKVIYADYFTFPKRNQINMKRRRSDKVNVLIIGVDAISRLNLHRQMPKTVRFLKTQVSSIEMLGYNKIGDNTFPNLVAILSGLTEGELTKQCWSRASEVFDDCPFVWRKYQNSGFHTAYAEDSVQIGLFNYQKVGFRKQPTDYYGQIYHLVAEAKEGYEHRLNTHLCVGNRMAVDLLVEETKSFVIRMKQNLSWGLFWSTSLSHDYLNLPRYGDETYLDLMETLKAEGIFNSSIVIFLSDHGIRWGGIRETYQGYIEERLPFLFITFPDWFESEYPMAVRNLRTNRRRLTTPFDLYETLIDLIDTRNIKNLMLKERMKSTGKPPRGMSLFLSVPENRSCKDAGITENWCTCHSSKPLSTNDTTVQEVSLALTDHLNRLLKDYPECSKLSLEKVHSARKEEVAMDREEEEKAHRDRLTDFFIVIETIPGNGVFEATVRYSSRETIVGKKSKVVIIDPVSRLNTYGTQSRCIMHYQLKLYCYCLN